MPIAIEWEPKEKYEIDDCEVIAWIASNKGFNDCTAKLFYLDCNWWWSESSDVVKRPDLIRGVVPWPKAPVEYSYDGEKDA